MDTLSHNRVEPAFVEAGLPRLFPATSHISGRRYAGVGITPIVRILAVPAASHVHEDYHARRLRA